MCETMRFDFRISSFYFESKPKSILNVIDEGKSTQTVPILTFLYQRSERKVGIFIFDAFKCKKRENKIG